NRTPPGAPQKTGSPTIPNHGLFSYMLPYLELAPLWDGLSLDVDPSSDTLGRYTDVPTYVCPSWPDPSVFRSQPQAWLNGAITTYQGSNGAHTVGNRRLVKSQFGDLPNNGMVRFGEGSSIRDAADAAAVKFREVADGLSKTVFVMEFVQRDSGSAPPGNVRAWVLSNNGQKALYSAKTVGLPPNQTVMRDIAGIDFNELPFGSRHQGGMLAVFGDGSVRWVDDFIAANVYKALSTIDSQEAVAGLP
ncbi:MAG: hypothetical protein RLZZ440_969, partial [Planctomycetota bacterium]